MQLAALMHFSSFVRAAHIKTLLSAHLTCAKRLIYQVCKCLNASCGIPKCHRISLLCNKSKWNPSSVENQSTVKPKHGEKLVSFLLIYFVILYQCHLTKGFIFATVNIVACLLQQNFLYAHNTTIIFWQQIWRLEIILQTFFYETQTWNT